MNEYCKHKVYQFHESFTKRSFDQDDVALFIVLTRDYSAKGSIVRELGDFLAHPDEKDRGIVLDSVKHAAALFEENCLEYFKNEGLKPPVFRGLGTLDELVTDIQTIFGRAGISLDQINRDDDHFRDFVFCLVFLLSSFNLKLENRLFELKVQYAHSLELYISYESLNFPRHVARLTILSLGNVWIQCLLPFGSTQYILKNHIARRFEEGLLGAIAYQDDLVGKTFSAQSFQRGKVWPLLNLRKNT